MLLINAKDSDLLSEIPPPFPIAIIFTVIIWRLETR